jgi:hypothetical protein
MKEIADSLIEILITLIHKIDARAERKVKKELILEDGLSSQVRALVRTFDYFPRGYFSD